MNATLGDPIAALIGSARGDRTWAAATLAIAVFVHAAAALAMPRLAVRGVEVERAIEMVDIDIPKPAPYTPPQPAPLPQPTSEVPKPTAPAMKRAPSRLAEAAQVLTKKEDADAPVDLTSTFVSGLDTAYDGGATASGGVNANAAARAVAVADQPPAAGGAPPARAGPDRSRRPGMAGTARWKCPFPPEADTAQIDSALVTIRVDVDATGKVRKISTLRDPGYGFGREAVRCALTKTWDPALDHGGSLVDGTTVVNVRFER